MNPLPQGVTNLREENRHPMVVSYEQRLPKRGVSRLSAPVRRMETLAEPTFCQLGVRSLFAAAYLFASWLAAGSAWGDNRVLMIGIDGAGGRYVQSASTPNLDALAELGAARYDFLNEGALIPNPPEPYGASGVNWTTIVTGASAASHRVSDNGFGANNLAHVPHWFKHIKDNNPSLFTASIVNWAPINDETLPDQYADVEISFTGLPLDQEDIQVRDAAVDLLNTGDPHAIFLHFDQVDGAGHAFSWGSPQHLAAIQAVDGLIGDIGEALLNRPGVQSGEENWLILVSADHGAAPGEFSHVASQGLPNWEVPMIVSGSSVPPGTQLPQGTLRDMAPTALWHLGIDPLATTVEGNVIGIPYGPPNGIVGDVNQDGVVAGNGTGPAASDDVTAFVNGWFSTGHQSVGAAYGAGDLNLDRRTDLSDWIILHKLNPAMAQAALRALAVPEPQSAALAALMATAWAGRSSRRVHRRETISSSCNSTRGMVCPAVMNFFYRYCLPRLA